MTTMIHYIPFIFSLIIVSAILAALYRYLLGNGNQLSQDKKFPRQMVFLLLIFIALWVTVLFLPIDEKAKSELSTVLGIIFSALFAISSTTILTNIMAGIVLRITNPFALGDFIRIDGHFGRVSERGLFNTELQTEERAFVSIPNGYLIKTPISAIHPSGTVVSVSLSLGYDLHHRRIEQLLLAAAEKSGLEKPFVHILELGDFSVTYRLSGFLKETKKYVTSKSNLFASVLDELHENGIEILSPNYMAQRPTDPKEKVIPSSAPQIEKTSKQVAESVVFDKAEKAKNIERFKKQLLADIDALKQEKKAVTGDEKDSIEARIDEKAGLLEKLELLLEDDD